MNFDTDAFIEALREAQRVRCPYCNTVYDPYEMEDMRLMTYWGSEGGPVKVICHGCDKTYHVREDVKHTYSAAKTADEL